MKTTQTNLLSIGIHSATVTSFAVRAPKEEGKAPYVAIGFRSGQHMVNFYGSLKKDASKKTDAYSITMTALATLGYTPETVKTFEKDVIGREAMIVVEHDTLPSGSVIAKVKFINEAKEYTTLSLEDAIGGDLSVPEPKEVEVAF